MSGKKHLIHSFAYEIWRDASLRASLANERVSVVRLSRIEEACSEVAWHVSHSVFRFVRTTNSYAKFCRLTFIYDPKVCKRKSEIR